MTTKQKKLSTGIGNLSLTSPLIAASGTFGYAQELEGLVDLKYFGAITTKTITIKPRPGNPPPRLVETPCGLLNSIGLDNPGIDIFLKEKWPYLAKLKTPVIVSIGGESISEFVQLAKRLDKISNLKAIEVNISCPNIKRVQSTEYRVQSNSMFAQNANDTFEIVSTLRKLTKKTLIVKLTPNVTDISEIALACEKAGADVISLVNTYYGLVLDINTRKPILANVTGGLSGPAIKPLGLYATYKTFTAVKLPIIAGGGIMNAQDAIEYLICGASALSLGTANFINPKAAKEILEGIERYLRKHKIRNIRSLKGSLLA